MKSVEFIEKQNLQTLKNGKNLKQKKTMLCFVLEKLLKTQLEGVNGEEEANRMRGTVVYAAREELPVPEGGCFIADLIGLPVKHADTGEVLGTLTQVDPRAHGDLYTVKTPYGDRLLPAVEQFVTRIDTDDAVYVRPIPGLLDGGEEQV